ncbi:MAG: 4-hydroxy-3-methylbut-2-enyl diphosphate reductase [Dehalococcoidia bacterium]|nr:4-hydroxy-3-methylbut-2-enyl diphosphate reductase [Chloroflexota bacterium]
MNPEPSGGITVEIRLTSEKGFCFGVRRAIELAENALTSHESRVKRPESLGGEGDSRLQTPDFRLLSGRRLASLGAIVHNRQVIERLMARGMRIIESLDEANGDTLLIPSHGVGRQIMSQIDARKLSMIDATCPIVRNAQEVAHRLHREGFMVLVFGDASHTEVKGLLSWAGERAMATTRIESGVWSLESRVPGPDSRLSTLDSGLLKIRRIGVLSQTTQSQTQFAAFLAQLIDSQLASLSEIYVFNTICDATTRRQSAALQLASEVDLMLVIGGHDSANTRRLAEICSSTGVRTLHIESADELDPPRYYGASRIGIAGGASTPEWVIEEVICKVLRCKL